MHGHEGRRRRSSRQEGGWTELVRALHGTGTAQQPASEALVSVAVGLRRAICSQPHAHTAAAAAAIAEVFDSTCLFTRCMHVVLISCYE